MNETLLYKLFYVTYAYTTPTDTSHLQVQQQQQQQKKKDNIVVTNLRRLSYAYLMSSSISTSDIMSPATSTGPIVFMNCSYRFC